MRHTLSPENPRSNLRQNSIPTGRAASLPKLITPNPMLQIQLPVSQDTSPKRLPPPNNLNLAPEQEILSPQRARRQAQTKEAIQSLTNLTVAQDEPETAKNYPMDKDQIFNIIDTKDILSRIYHTRKKLETRENDMHRIKMRELKNARFATTKTFLDRIQKVGVGVESSKANL